MDEMVSCPVCGKEKRVHLIRIEYPDNGYTIRDGMLFVSVLVNEELANDASVLQNVVLTRIEEVKEALDHGD